MAAAPTPGAVEVVSPLIRRVTADNPGPFTGPGTGTLIIGQGSVAVVDPGPDDDRHLAALVAALGTEQVAAIIVTHTHRDHSPLAVRLRARTGAPVHGPPPAVRRPPPPELAHMADQLSAAFDAAYAPDHLLADGDTLAGPGWTLEAVATPGHASNHLAFALPEEHALLPGDHVMGWSTTVVAPPDGDMGDYMASLARLLARDDVVLHPTHGASIANPAAHMRSLLGHRRMREGAIVDALARGPATVPGLVERMYPGVDMRLRPAAGLSVLAHLLHLERQGAARRDGDAGAWARA